jgi:endonuclease/exonuclease/phosphatase family metal-dependent hydrolase
VQRRLALATLVALIGGGWFFASRFKIEGLGQLKLAPRSGADAPAAGSDDTDGPPPAHAGPTIRIASFNIQTLGDRKASKSHVMDVLADTVRRFDVVAIQEIRTKRGEFLMRDFVERINSKGNRHFNFLIGPRLGRTTSKEQYAFIFDTASVMVDRHGAYTLSDPDDLLHREPLVAQFRVRGPTEERAFTFILVNIHTDPDEAEEEVDVLADVYRVVRQASQGEDDVILLGDFNVPGSRFDPDRFGRLGMLPGVYFVIQDKPTNTRGSKLYDNIVIHRPSTVEYTGRGDVFDIHGTYNLTREQTLDVSDHLPIWAEFSLYENAAVPGRVATRPGASTR